MQVSEYKKVRAQGVGFVDDKKPIEETVERVNEWLCGSTGFGGFHGVEQRPQKCEGQAVVMGDEGKARSMKELVQMAMPMGEEGELQELQMKEAWESMKTLG